MKTAKRSLLLDWNDVVYEGRNELVFEFKNQEYGAYQIRREYHGNMILALGGAFLFVCLCFGAPIIYNLLQKTAEVPFIPKEGTEVDLSPDLYVPPAPPSTPPSTPPPPQKTLAELMPVVVKEDPKPDEKLPEQKPEDPSTNTTPSSEKGNAENGDAMGKDSDGEPETGRGLLEEKESPPYLIVEEMPVFKGGLGKMKRYLTENIMYPREPKEVGKSGVVHISFIVKKTGEITDVKVLQGVAGYPEFDKEALRVIKNMPAWIPGKMNGRAVSVILNLPIRFELR